MRRVVAYLYLCSLPGFIYFSSAQNPVCCVCFDNCVSTITNPDAIVPLPSGIGFDQATCAQIQKVAEVDLLIPAAFCSMLDLEDFRQVCGCSNAVVDIAPPTVEILVPAPVVVPSNAVTPPSPVTQPVATPTVVDGVEDDGSTTAPVVMVPTVANPAPLTPIAGPTATNMTTDGESMPPTVNDAPVMEPNSPIVASVTNTPTLATVNDTTNNPIAFTEPSVAPAVGTPIINSTNTTSPMPTPLYSIEPSLSSSDMNYTNSTLPAETFEPSKENATMGPTVSVSPTSAPKSINDAPTSDSYNQEHAVRVWTIVSIACAVILC